MKRILKNGLNLFVALLLLVSLSSIENALNQEPGVLSTKIDVSDNWKLVQSENGISIYFSEVHKNGETFLHIKFENTTSEKIDFTWSLLKNSEAIKITEDEMIEVFTQLSSSEVKLYGITSFIILNNEDTFGDFTVAINTIK